MFFRKNFPDGSMNFLNISHGENIEAQKSHRAAPDFSILAAWRHQGKVASKIESHQKMKWYRENQEAVAKAGDGGEAGRIRKSKRRRGDPVGSPLRLYRKRDALFQGALPPRGYAAKGFYRLRGALRKGGDQARCLLPRTRTAPARTATVMRLSHRPIAAPSAVLGLSVPLLPVLPPLLALGSAAPQTVHLPSL